MAEVYCFLLRRLAMSGVYFSVFVGIPALRQTCVFLAK